MAYMVVTLEVSKLSGWLKADASCRVEGRACDAGGERCEPEGGRACGVVAAHKRHARGWPDVRPVRAKGTRGAHGEHVAHGRDAGGVEAQRLVEGRRLLPSRREGMRCSCDAGGRRCEPGGGRAWGVVAAHKRHARGCGLTQGLGAKGTREAHVEHGAHGRDAGGVEAQRLVEGQRLLPSRGEGMRCGGERCEPEGGRACGVVAAHKRHAREKARLKAWGPRARAERT